MMKKLRKTLKAGIKDFGWAFDSINKLTHMIYLTFFSLRMMMALPFQSNCMTKILETILKKAGIKGLRWAFDSINRLISYPFQSDRMTKILETILKAGIKGLRWAFDSINKLIDILPLFSKRGPPFSKRLHDEDIGDNTEEGGHKRPPKVSIW